MSDKKLNRREFLERAAMLGAAAVGAGALVSACDPPDPEADPDEPAPDQPDEFSCNDDQALAGLNEDEIERRENHDYVDQTPNPNETCDNCMHWEDPAAGEDCGGCAVLPGPFHPDGWCDLWQPMA